MKLARAITPSCTKIVQQSRVAPTFQRIISRAQSNGTDLPARQSDTGSLSRWGVSPFSMLHQVEREMNNLMRGFGLDTLELSPRSALGLAVDIKETENSYSIVADVPGLSRDDVTIEITPDHVLRISGERKQESKEEEEGFVRVERSYGSFTRSFKLPTHVDATQISAEMEQGLLTIEIPKVESKEDEKTIKVDIHQKKKK